MWYAQKAPVWLGTVALLSGVCGRYGARPGGPCGRDGISPGGICLTDVGVMV